MSKTTCFHCQVSAPKHGEAQMQGHWVLASMGKKVLRPGGIELTRSLIDSLRIPGSDVVEFAPGMGRTAHELIGAKPGSYIGVDANMSAAEIVRRVVGSMGKVVVADASETGLPDGCADVVIGEALLTMQSDKAKAAIVAEAARLLRPGGRFGIHEVGLYPENVEETIKIEIRQALSRSIRINARPQTIQEWTLLLESAGLVVASVKTAPMAMLEVGRFISDEGWLGLLRFVKNMLFRPQGRARVLDMRRTFRKYAGSINGVVMVAVKPAEPASSKDVSLQNAVCCCGCS